MPGGGAQRLPAEGALRFDWWTALGSPALDRTVRRALAANPSVSAARAALRQAEELVYAQRGFYFPAATPTYQLERHKIAGNVNSSETPGVQANGENYLPRVEDPNEFPHNTPLDYTFHTAELTVGFVPDVFGANRRAVESLAALAEVQRYALEATYVTLVSNVVAAAIEEASLRAQIAATGRMVDAQTEAVRILRDELRLGYATRLDVAAEETALADTAATLPPLESRLEQTRDLLRALGGDLPTAADELIELDALTLPAEVPLSVPGALLAHRPDVRAAEAQVRAANAQVGAALAAMLPAVSIDATAGGNAVHAPLMFSSGGPFWSLVGDLRQPLFAGGTLLHTERAARAALRQAAEQYRFAVITAYQNVADALRAALADADTLGADADAEQAAQLTFDLTRRQRDVGYVNELTALAAESTLLAARLARIQAQAVRFGDTVALIQSLGGGWWQRPSVPAP